MNAQLTILDEVHARIANITTANEYDIQLASGAIKRAKLTPFVNGDLPAVNYWPGSDILDFKTGQMETRQLSLVVEVYAITRDEPFTDVGIKIGNQVVTALFRSTDSPAVSSIPSPSLGGLVEELTINSLTPVIGEGQSPWCGAVLDISIRYNIEVGNFSTIVKF